MNNELVRIIHLDQTWDGQIKATLVILNLQKKIVIKFTFIITKNRHEFPCMSVDTTANLYPRCQLTSPNDGTGLLIVPNACLVSCHLDVSFSEADVAIALLFSEGRRIQVLLKSVLHANISFPVIQLLEQKKILGG